MSGLLFLHQSRGSLLAHAIFSDVVPVLFMRDLDCLPVAFCSKIEVFLHVSVFLGGGGDVFTPLIFCIFPLKSGITSSSSALVLCSVVATSPSEISS